MLSYSVSGFSTRRCIALARIERFDEKAFNGTVALIDQNERRKRHTKVLVAPVCHQPSLRPNVIRLEHQRIPK